MFAKQMMTPVIVAVVLCGGTLAEAGATRKVKFVNNTGKDVNDLHIELKQACDVPEYEPFGTIQGDGTSRIDLKDGTVEDGESADLKFKTTSNAVEIKKWWWTIDGKREGNENKDNGTAELSFSGGPAAGDGQVLVAISDRQNVFQTRRGAPPDIQVQMFSMFLGGFVDDQGDPLIHVAPANPTALLVAGNVLGTPELELRIEVLRPDSFQPIEITDPEFLPGACCLPRGECIEVQDEACSNMGGRFQGSGIICGFVECQPQNNCTGRETLSGGCKTKGCGEQLVVKLSGASPNAPATIVVDGQPRQDKQTNKKGKAKFKLCPVGPGRHLVELAQCPVAEVFECR
ncbi:MAG: hypothetical protein C4547_05520 [Phycisphaerales bacterium]|nr:MAG: hypothetical protein C4547_05520 [Phycisphaerales bacterium]